MKKVMLIFFLINIQVHGMMRGLFNSKLFTHNTARYLLSRKTSGGINPVVAQRTFATKQDNEQSTITKDLLDQVNYEIENRHNPYYIVSKFKRWKGLLEQLLQNAESRKQANEHAAYAAAYVAAQENEKKDAQKFYDKQMIEQLIAKHNQENPAFAIKTLPLEPELLEVFSVKQILLDKNHLVVVLESKKDGTLKLVELFR